jgi:predicted dehydrogenase
MATFVHIYGAGSIGNHLTNACRSKGWDVTVVDLDKTALERMKTSIYPSRYGAWDNTIKLVTPDQLHGQVPDVVIVGTPPDSHLKIAFSVLEKSAPKIMCVEKPFCTPDISQCDRLVAEAAAKGTLILTGYNHTLVPATVEAVGRIQDGFLGETQTLIAEFREYWGGIFSAHPWLSGPSDSYLGFWEKGGGASGEHSHAINIWQFYARTLGAGRIVEVNALLDYVEKDGCSYDRLCQLHVHTEKGLAGIIVQDVITEPSKKWVRIQGDKGFLEWRVNYQKDEDRIIYGTKGQAPMHKVFSKTRPDDFKPEIDHIGRLLSGEDKASESPIHLDCGLETMLVIAAAHLSAKKRRPVKIDYSKGWTEKALSI